MQLLTNSLGQGMTEYETLLDVRWQAKSWNWVDPLKDIKASVEGINAGIKTRGEVIAEQGGDIEDVFDQLAYEQQLAKDKGLNLNGVSQEEGVIDETD